MFKKMFTGGDTSIKRVMAFYGFLLLCGTLVLNSFSHENIKPSKELVDAVMYIIIICIGGNVIEKFKK
jgi:hypothetical protein